MTRRSGQVALYLVVVLVALAVLTLANVGVFLAVRAKNHAMNAGDAAALAAARRQGELLNEIGRLNLRHAEAEYVGDWEKALEIVNEQRRIAFLGPLDCLRAASDAAKDNGAVESSKFTEILRRHVSEVLTKYVQNPDLYPEPWEGAWQEYADALSSAIGGGLAAGADNIEFVDALECFPLTSKSFYSMIAGRSWCKMVVSGTTWLLDMDLHNLPQPKYGAADAVVNCEVCPLHLKTQFLALDADEATAFRELLERNGAKFPEPEEGESFPAKDSRPPDDPSRVYFFYDGDWYVSPSKMISDGNLPLVGKFREEFDVKGCASVFRVVEDIPQLLSGTVRRSAWSAAAKPFGTIVATSERSVVTDSPALGMVLPAFEQVRLVPLALADERDLSTADDAWLDHVREHVPRLFDANADGLSPTCGYCAQLKKWDDPKFRSRAAEWVAANAETCLRGGGGGGGGGGTSYAH